MDIERVKSIITKRYEGIVCKDTYGETTFFYNPNEVLKNGVYFCTIKEKDGPNDKSSLLNANGNYRISTGITKEKFLELFAEIPKRPSKGEVIKGNYDFSIENIIMPHPIYGWMSWVQILSPSDEMMNNYLNLIDISYEKAKVKFQERTKKIKV